MLFGVSAFYFLGAFIALMVASRMVKLDRNLLLLGWLSWVAGVAVKMLIATIITLTMPALYIPDTPQYVITLTLLETTEVLSAFMFLMYHPMLRKSRDMKTLSIFGLGFGVGEALTLALFTFLPVDSTLSWNLALTTLERFSAIMIHMASILFIGYFLVNKKRSNLIWGILSKDLSVTLTFGLFAMLSFSYLTYLPLIEALLFAYAVGFLFFAHHVGIRQKIKIGIQEPDAKPNEKISFNKILLLIPVGSAMLLISELSALFLARTDRMSFIMVSMGIMFVLVLCVYKIISIFRQVSATEFSAGIFLGVATARVAELAMLEPAIIASVPVQALLTTPMLFFAVMIAALVVYRFLHSESLMDSEPVQLVEVKLDKPNASKAPAKKRPAKKKTSAKRPTKKKPAKKKAGARKSR